MKSRAIGTEIVALEVLLFALQSESVSRLGTTLLPTLVFTLVLAGIVEERFAAQSALVGGLVLCTLTNTLLPSLLLGQRAGDITPIAGTPEGADAAIATLKGSCLTTISQPRVPQPQGVADDRD